jgi:hypothetical protein
MVKGLTQGYEASVGTKSQCVENKFQRLGAVLKPHVTSVAFISTAFSTSYRNWERWLGSPWVHV